MVRGRSHFRWRLNTRNTCCLLLCYRLVLRSDFRTECDFVKGYKLFESQFVSRHERAILVQITTLWISQPLNQNQPMDAVTVMSIPFPWTLSPSPMTLWWECGYLDEIMKETSFWFWYGSVDTEILVHVRQWYEKMIILIVKTPESHQQAHSLVV